MSGIIFTQEATTILSNVDKIINERLFLSVYLPLLFSENPGDFNTRWVMEIANSPHTPVTIVDDNNQKVIVVPPLRAVASTSINKNIDGLLELIKEKRNQSPILAERVLAANLPKFVNLEGGNTDTHKEEWKALLTHYGYSDLLEETTEPTSEEQYGVLLDDEDDD